MSPEDGLGEEKKSCAKGSISTHPTSGKEVERPHSNQERDEIDEVLYVHCLHIGKDLCPHFFDKGCEHHESRTIVLEMVTRNGNRTMLGPRDVRLERVGCVIV